jgi:pimeloyl-ACP methyl ester carboxylesterase
LQAFGKEARLEKHNVPTLVVQGMADTIFPPAHGRDLASRIKDARLLEVDGMGHDLEGDAIRIVFDAIAEHLAPLG